MKVSRIFLALFLLAVLGYGCSNPAAQENQNLEQDRTDNDEEDEVQVNLIPDDPQDDWPPHTYGSSGLDFVKLGDTIMWRELKTEATIKDTVFAENMVDVDGQEKEVAWNVRMVNFEDGKVLLETDFDTGAYLNRVQIESPSYKHVHTGIHVGSTVADLKEAYGDLYVRPFPEYGVIEVLPDNHNIFHIESHPSVSEDPNTWKLELIPDDLKIVRIVVM